MAVPTGANAQFGLVEKALANVESLGMFYVYGGFHPRSRVLTAGPRAELANQTGFDGFGFEMSISVGSIPGNERDCPPPKPGALAPVDTLEQYTAVKTVDGKATNTTYVKVRAKPAKKCYEDDKASFQVALGYSQIGGFAAQDTTFDLYTAIRELPSVAFYATYKPDQSLSQYFGIRAGIVQLHSLRAYDSTSTSSGFVYTGGGSTFQLGIAAGLVADVGPLNIFAEPSYNFRKINSIEWTPVANVIPRRLPRELNFSGWQVAAGIEVPIKQAPLSP